MYYRAFCYLALVPGDVPNAVALRTERQADREAADRVLTALLALPGVTGGGLEVEVPGIGWVNDDEVETVQYLARMREPVEA